MKRSPLPTLLGVALLILLSHSTSTLATERQRIPWTESQLIGSPDPPLPYRVVRAYEKLPLFAPVYLRPEPGTDRAFFVDHKGDWKEPGGLRYFTDRDDASASQPLLPLDRLIYGFCFHPEYRDNGFIFLITNGPMSETNKQDRISRFTIIAVPCTWYEQSRNSDVLIQDAVSSRSLYA